MASSAETAAPGGHGHGEGETRRDFLLLATGAFGALGTALAVWPFIDQMNPAADTLAASTTEVNLEPIKVGQRIVVKWRGKPIFITRRTNEQIKEAEDVKMSALVDPQKDSDRVKNPNWLIMIGVCTHLGCIPKGNAPGTPRGAFGGWFCPCHGSTYDTSGRIRSGPAPKNLVIPPYTLMPSNTDVKTVKIG